MKKSAGNIMSVNTVKRPTNVIARPGNGRMPANAGKKNSKNSASMMNRYSRIKRLPPGLSVL